METHTKTQEPRKYVSGSFLATRYGLHPKVIHKFGVNGILPRVRVGTRSLRYDLAECDALIAASREPRTQG